MKTKWMLRWCGDGGGRGCGDGLGGRRRHRGRPAAPERVGRTRSFRRCHARLVVLDGEIQNRQIFEDIDDGVRAEQQDDFFYEATLGLRLFRETDDFLGLLPASTRPAATRTSTISTTRAWAKRRKSAWATAN